MRIAGIQTDVVFRNINANLTILESHVRSEVAQGTHLTVFPECFNTGYCFDSLEDAMLANLFPTTERIARLCRELRIRRHGMPKNPAADVQHGSAHRT
ncbi:MAG: nitrilase-related carbon-nitrogen hydrolase [Planctomycetaceae bacterium]